MFRPQKKKITYTDSQWQVINQNYILIAPIYTDKSCPESKFKKGRKNEHNFEIFVM